MKQFERLAKKFSLLCATNNEYSNRDYVDSIFNSVHYAKELEEIYAIFEENEIDIVFIDTDILDFDWTKIVSKFRSKFYDLPIVIVTALKSKDIFEKVIELKITQVVFKPSQRDKLESTIRDIVYKLQNKLDAKELYYKKQKEKQKSITLSSVSSILDVMRKPIIIASEEKIVYVNKYIYKLFKGKGIFLKNTPTRDELKKIVENFTDDMRLENIPYGKSFDLKFYYSSKGLKKVFIPSKNDIKLEGLQNSFIISFTDVAPLMMQIEMMNYQKNKIDNYKNLIEELLAKRVFKDNKKAIITKEKLVEDRNSIDETLDNKGIEILRKDHSFRLSAVDYVGDLDEFLYQDIRDLKNIEEDILVNIAIFDDNPNVVCLGQISKLFNEQGSVIISLIEFVDLGNAVCSLSDFLNTIDDAQIEKSHKEIVSMLKNILEDLIQWRDHIFITQDTLDIHYLDASLFSSILQFQVGITAQASQESGELELF